MWGGGAFYMGSDSLAATMRMLSPRAVHAGVFVFASVVAGTAAAQTAPRTPWGDPDLQGTYTNKYETSTPLERP